MFVGCSFAQIYSFVATGNTVILIYACVTGPTSGPENISIRPVSDGVGRSRARTTPHNNDGDDDAVGDGASVRDGNRITLMINWTVCFILLSYCSLC